MLLLICVQFSENHMCKHAPSSPVYREQDAHAGHCPIKNAKRLFALKFMHVHWTVKEYFMFSNCAQFAS